MPEQNTDSLAPEFIPIPDGLRAFIAVVLILVEHQERGVFQREDRYYWNEVCWSAGSIFTVDNDSYGAHIMCYFSDRDEAQFEFQYTVPFGDHYTPGWEFEFNREELARVADRTVEHLALYCCAHPLCGYRTSHEYNECPRCYLELGREINQSHSQRVLGICPYCHQPLRSLYAQQCPHCLMDWHDPDHPTTLGTKS